MKTLVTLLFLIAGIVIPQKSITSENNSLPPVDLTSPGSSDIISVWIDMNLYAVRNVAKKAQQFRQLAYIGVALYESVVAGDPAHKSLSGQLNEYPGTPPPPDGIEICWQASANSAVATMMRYFYNDNPVTTHRIDSTEAACIKKLSKDFGKGSIENGSNYGKLVAEKIIEWSRSDLSEQVNNPYTLPKGPGKFEPVPPAMATPIQPYLGKCRTMVKGSIDNSIPPPPLTFSQDSSSSFYAMVKEVYRTSQQKDPTKIAIALFWDDFPDGKSLTAAGHWESILNSVMKKENMSLIMGARAYAEMFIAMHDATIGCFKAKYTYVLLRPVTYIRKYFPDAAQWEPLILTPPHPEYPAAHATISTAAAVALTDIMGKDYSFVDNSYAYRGYPARSYKSFIDAGREAGMSRLYGGIHYTPSILAGYEQGRTIAQNVISRLSFE